MLITDEAMRGMLSMVAVVSRTAYMRLSAGTVSFVCPATTAPTSSAWRSKRAGERAVVSPGMLSSLSSVPPVCPRPRPEYLAQRTPRLASTGTRMRVVESDTPPVECLSAYTPPPCGRGVFCPLFAMARVRSAHSSSSMPFKSTAIQKAAICASVAEPSATAETKKEISSPFKARRSFFFWMMSQTVIRQILPCRGKNRPAARLPP